MSWRDAMAAVMEEPTGVWDKEKSWPRTMHNCIMTRKHVSEWDWETVQRVSRALHQAVQVLVLTMATGPSLT